MVGVCKTEGPAVSLPKDQLEANQITRTHLACVPKLFTHDNDDKAHSHRKYYVVTDGPLEQHGIYTNWCVTTNLHKYNSNGTLNKGNNIAHHSGCLKIIHVQR